MYFIFQTRAQLHTQKSVVSESDGGGMEGEKQGEREV
jgi:hypothetical protein